MIRNNHRSYEGKMSRWVQDGYQPQIMKRGYQPSLLEGGYQPSVGNVNVSSPSTCISCNPFSNHTTPIVMMQPTKENNVQLSPKK